MKAPCNTIGHFNRPGVLCLHLLPFSKRVPSTAFPRKLHSPSKFCGFRIYERASLSLIHDRISVLWPSAPIGKRDQMKIQTFRPPRANSRRILALTTGFWKNVPNYVERSARECPDLDLSESEKQIFGIMSIGLSVVTITEATATRMKYDMRL
ncbi:hypothetical protein AVEN_67649-1 [Araneus ventricosus]|uniref:Uncharacterized protein n=1 Tax=Araneus ventricosus TaxID=182803 RepID=A0A4Y2X6Y5_ARAVE|nr:hypothetical protein AVEN_67649-1 [Araneus ventricosus]